MFGALDISTSGLIAQRTRMTAIADNLANKDTLLAADGSYAPFQARAVLFSAGDVTNGDALGVTARVERTDSFRLGGSQRPGRADSRVGLRGREQSRDGEQGGPGSGPRSQ